MLESIDDDGIVLLLGAGRWATRIPWQALEEIPELFPGRGWLRTSGTYTTDADPDTLSGLLKRYVNRETANWVAVVLEEAEILELDRTRRIRAGLRDDWAG